MNDNEFWVKIVSIIARVVMCIILSIAGYWVTDRYFQGHAVVTYPATVTQTK